jgi:hypothetical protein
MHGHTLRLTMLLKVRQAIRDQRRQALAEVLRQEQLLTHRLLALDEELIGRRTAVEEEDSSRTLVVQRRLEAESRENSLIARRGALKRDLGELLQEVDRRQQALLAAETELRAMENLHDQQSTVHAADQHCMQSRARNREARPAGGLCP